MQKRHAVPAVVLVEHITLAIAKHEGYWNPKSLGRRNNNPGNLRWWGKERRRNGFVHFTTPADGFRALRLQVWKNVIYRRLSLYTFFAGNGGYPGYAPRNDGNDPFAYAHAVRCYVSKYGIDMDTDKPIGYYASDSAALLDREVPYPGLGRFEPGEVGGD